MRRASVAAMLLSSLALPRSASAQAWLPPRGEGSLALTLGDYGFSGHFDSDGSRDPFGGTHARSVAVEVIYGITDRLTAGASLPFITTRLSGSFPPGVPLGPLDDGRYHGDFQDVRADLRLLVRAQPVAVTPVLGVNIPSHRYEVVGEAVPGKRTREVFAGLNVGRALGSRAYVHGRYVYSWVEKVVPDVKKLDRSNVDAEAGLTLARLTLRALGAWQITHGGLDLDDMRTRPGFFRDHDRAARTNYFNLGGGASFEATRTVDLYVVFYRTMSGQNAHQAYSLSLGASWEFGGGFGGRGARGLREPAAPPKAASR
jgi:hypothetical protein